MVLSRTPRAHQFRSISKKRLGSWQINFAAKASNSLPGVNVLLFAGALSFAVELVRWMEMAEAHSLAERWKDGVW